MTKKNSPRKAPGSTGKVPEGNTGNGSQNEETGEPKPGINLA